MTTIVIARHRAPSALHALDHGLIYALDHLLRRRAEPGQLDVMVAPHERALGSVRPAQAYQRGQHVLAYIANAWHPATVLATGDAAAYVRYQLPGVGGTGVETVHPASIAATPNEATTAPPSNGTADRQSALDVALPCEEAVMSMTTVAMAGALPDAERPGRRMRAKPMLALAPAVYGPDAPGVPRNELLFADGHANATPTDIGGRCA